MTAKARAIADELASALKSRLPSLAVTQSDDADQAPLIAVGANALIKVAPQAWPTAQTSEGNPGRSFGPHCIKIVLQTGAGLNPMSTLLPLLGEVAMRGTAVEVYETATSPDTGDITAANLKATFHPTTHGIIANQ